jgi:hypothetical protein
MRTDKPCSPIEHASHVDIAALSLSLQSALLQVRQLAAGFRLANRKIRFAEATTRCKMTLWPRGLGAKIERSTEVSDPGPSGASDHSANSTGLRLGRMAKTLF